MEMNYLYIQRAEITTTNYHQHFISGNKLRRVGSEPTPTIGHRASCELINIQIIMLKIDIYQLISNLNESII